MEAEHSECLRQNVNLKCEVEECKSKARRLEEQLKHFDVSIQHHLDGNVQIH